MTRQQAPLTSKQPKNQRSRSLRIETEATISGGVGGLIGTIFAVIAFSGGGVPIWGGWSIGLGALFVTLVVGMIASFTGYWRSRNLPGQEWRHELSPWTFTVNSASVALVHTAIACLFVIGFYAVMQRGFIGLTLSTFTTVLLAGVTAALVGYWLYLSVSHMTTVRMTGLLIIFITAGTLSSMATSQDPKWWEYHFSQLGTFGDGSSGLFNITLLIAGALVTAFAVYLRRDIHTLYTNGVIRQAHAPRIISNAFMVMGVMLACVGLFPVHVSLTLHNTAASGMAVVFAALLVGTPFVLRGLPWPFFAASAAFLIGLLGGAWLFFTGVYGLTAFELLAFVIIFSWIAVFIRFISAAAGHRIYEETHSVQAEEEAY